MATLVFSAIGATVGNFIGGPFGAAIGQAIGATAGAMIDQRLLAGTPATRHGPRMKDLTVAVATDGKPIPRVLGRARVSGEMIWATEYQEATEVSRSGGKGGASQKTVSYSYYANCAVAVCAGPIAGIGRIWADGTELDLTRVTHRIHLGDETGEPDALILAKEAGPVPAYRGTAYVVFERFPVADYGNRIPHFTFEVWNPIDALERQVRAVTLIPGATEFGYATTAVNRVVDAGTEPENRHTLRAGSDIAAALDELQAVCPNIERVALVVAWFGDDLRAGNCTIRPKVIAADRVTLGPQWSVAGLDRASAAIVSRHAGLAAYGGSPADASVVEAIRELKTRGLAVTLVPFVLMDIPAVNARPDPYGGAEQAAHPWRGRITCHPAPGRPGSPDKTAAVGAEVAALFGTAASAHFAVVGDGVAYSGPAEWSLRRMVLHYATLAKAAGGVDAFVIGSELRGLTTLRSAVSTYPAVDRLCTLAADVRAILGAGTRLTYAADWSEWFGHQPSDGSGDVHFHLDPLWAHPAIDAIGIDVYWPLADWRDGDHLDAASARTANDRAYLASRLAGGEGHDWFYADAAARAAQTRTPITDGAHGKPWVFRFKDLLGWWQNPHFNRPAGVEAATPTAWVPRSKPIWFTELGAAAVDRGANDPAVFPDAKSAESRLPNASNGGRDDVAQRAVLAAHLGRWDPAAAGFDPAANPLSPLYGGRMVDAAHIHLWTWDARPTPAFPAARDVWADGDNWATGHWLNGRLGAAPLDAVVRLLAAETGVDIDIEDGLDDIVDGLVIDGLASVRDVVEPLAQVFRFDIVDAGDRLVARSRDRGPVLTLAADDLVEPERDPRLVRARAQESELAAEITIGFVEALADYDRVTTRATRPAARTRHVASVDLSVVAPVALVETRAASALQAQWAGRETLEFSLARRHVGLEPGDVVSLGELGEAGTVVIERIDDTDRRRISARRHDRAVHRAAVPAVIGRAPRVPLAFGAPRIVMLDLPPLDDGADAHRPWIAGWARPWPGRLTVWKSVSGASFTDVVDLDRRATIGTLAVPLGPGPTAIWDRSAGLDVILLDGVLAARAEIDVLSGENLAAIRRADGVTEVVAFAGAELIGPNRYRLTRLLRGLGGTEDATGGGHPAGSTFVLLDAAVRRLPIGRAELGAPRRYRVGPSNVDVGDAAMAEAELTAWGRGLRPFAPVHVRARRDPSTGQVAFTWVRRARIDGDGWDGPDVPLGEEAESYRLDLLDGAVVRRSVSLAAPRFDYAAAAEIADFGAPQSQFSLRLAQVSPSTGAGITREIIVHV